jgi:ribonuclease Z
MTDLRVTVLGTSAAQPTLRRGLSATVVRAHGEQFLIDCGEGTQRQMLHFGTGFALDFVLFTHFHADHFLGIIGFARTLSMAERKEPLELLGPAPGVHRLADWVKLDGAELSFEIRCRALREGESLQRRAYRVRAVEVDHRGPALGYVIEEPARPGVFDVERARALGIPAGPLYGRLQAGESITLASGRQITSAEVVGPARPGRKLAFSGDTRPCTAFANAASGADVLFHDSTFADADQARAIETRHSTAFEAAQIAARAGARRLILTHISARYDTCPDLLAREARRGFAGPIEVADDGLVIDVPLSPE